jgi:hypothetical protein
MAASAQSDFFSSSSSSGVAQMGETTSERAGETPAAGEDVLERIVGPICILDTFQYHLEARG